MKKIITLLLAGLLAVTLVTACQNESSDHAPQTPEDYIEAVRSDADMIIHKVNRYGTEDGTKEFTYTYERDGDLLKKTTVITGTMSSIDGTKVRYYDFVSGKCYFESSGKWKAGYSDYDGWDKYLEDDMEISFSGFEDESPVWKNENYRKDGDRYVMTEEAVAQLVAQTDFHDSYGDNPEFSIYFERRDGAYAFVERIQGEDASVYAEIVITVTLTDVTVELPQADE